MPTEFLQPAWSIFQRAKWYRQLGLNVDAMKRLILTECRMNLALLEPLKLDDTSSPKKQDDPACLEIASRLQLDALAFLLTTDDLPDKTFEELGKIPLPNEGENRQMEFRKETHESSTSVRERLQRLYVRMYAVRSLAEIRLNTDYENLDGIMDIRLRLRLQNIQNALIKVVRALSRDEED